VLSAVLASLPGIVPVHVADGCTHSFYRYSPTYDPEAWEGLPRGLVVQALQAEGVPLTEGFIPVLLDRALEATPRRRGITRPCPMAEQRWSATALGLLLPPHAAASRQRWLHELAEAITKVFEGRAALRALASQHDSGVRASVAF
jgi:hypothetical protein